jgi:transposase-like protein
MIANMKNGVSSHELARSLGVTQKTAWFMLQRIRLAMQDETGGGGKLGGEVEIDETYIGAKARNMHRGKRKALGMSKGRGHLGKVAVMGLLQRHGRVRTEVIDNGLTRPKVQERVRRNVTDGAAIYTDAFPSYTGLNDTYIHGVIDHAETYVDGQIHTNSMENYWSLLKRAIKGTYVSIEPFHLFRYLDEQAFRFNERKLTDAERFSLAITGIVGKRLMYQDLIAAPSASGAPA